MADIDIIQAHELPHKNAIAAAQEVADRLAGEYALACAWDGDVLRFARAGVDGTLEVSAHQARIRIELGFLFKMFSAKIEEKAAAHMRKVFAGRA